MRIRHYMMLYWSVSTLLVAGVLCSLPYSFSEALFLSTSFLPTGIFLKYFLSQISLTKNGRKGVANTFFLCLSALLLTFLFILYGHVFLFLYETRLALVDVSHFVSVSGILMNPIFVLGILSLLIAGDYHIERFLKLYFPDSPQPIVFVSDRHQVTLWPDEILYVESNDTEVCIHATEGRLFRSRTRISAWANQLGNGFLRIHRAFLVRRAACTAMDGNSVVINDDERLPVSRKYKACVQSELAVAELKRRKEDGSAEPVCAD